VGIDVTLRDIVAKAVAALAEEGALPAVALPAVAVERAGADPAASYTTDVAPRLAAAAQAAGLAAEPHALAQTIAARIRETVAVVPAYDGLVSAVEVAETGIISLRVSVAPLV
jgi:hypothetical protein